MVWKTALTFLFLALVLGTGLWVWIRHETYREHKSMGATEWRNVAKTIDKRSQHALELIQPLDVLGTYVKGPALHISELHQRGLLHKVRQVSYVN